MLPAYLGLYVKIVASSIDRFFLTKVFLIKTIAYRISIVSPFLLNACRIVRRKFQPPFIGKNVEYQNFSDTHVKKYKRKKLDGFDRLKTYDLQRLTVSDLKSRIGCSKSA